MQLKPKQHQAYIAIDKFLHDTATRIFILKGYAGTGKTTMIKALLPLIKSMGKVPILMAPTGRAAKVLSEKTGQCASTIHRAIYQQEGSVLVLHDSNGEFVPVKMHKDSKIRSDGADRLHMYFAINTNDEQYNPQNSVLIIDESSMVSSVKSNNETLHFGTDVLINDLLTYARPHQGSKLIFVGDPAQLPPVGDSRSAALDPDYFRGLGYQVMTFELTEVLRQSAGNAILDNATMVRRLLESGQRNALALSMREGEVEPMEQSRVIDAYTALQPTPEIGQSIIVSYTNAIVKEYNDCVRDIYFPHKQYIQPGDVVQIVRNNYTYNEELLNGDFAKVVSAADTVDTISAPVYVERNGLRTRETISVDFRDVSLITERGCIIKCKIVDTLLDSSAPKLSADENVAVYINFVMRHGGRGVSNDQIKSAFMTDPYINAVHVKYGYAITGHKSQGGEWANAFVDFTGRKGLDNDKLRWVYTAITRAVSRLYCVNMPRITPFDRMTICAIRPASGPFASAQPRDVVCRSLPDSAEGFRKAKCLGTEQALDRLGYRLVSVQQLPYRDRYVIETPVRRYVYDCLYNKKGVYTKFMAVGESEPDNVIADAVRAEPLQAHTIDYVPPTAALSLLHSIVTAECSDLGIEIANITDRTRQWMVVYDLKTSGRYSYIQFYVDGNGAITSAMPYSDIGDQDTLLKSLINRLTTK